MAVFENPSQMWFGTERRMQWIDVPQTGADVSPIGMNASEVLLNGGAWVRNSWGSHKRYNFSWGDAATQETADAIQAYASGTYGRGLIYFHDPFTHERNVLPRYWADPSMALNYEAPPLVDGVWPTVVDTAANTLNLPIDTAVYVVPGNYDPQTSATELAIPIPPGHTLHLGAIYSSTDPAAGVRVRTSSSTILTPLSVSATNIAPTSVAGGVTGDWAYLGLVNGDGAEQTVSISAITARISGGATPVNTSGPWYPGEGNSGTRFEGKPTLVRNTGLFGGQVGVAATLVEVGAWE